MVLKYKTITDYPNATGFNQIAYPVRDAVAMINPFFVGLVGLMLVLIVASYYTFINLTGKTRIFNSVLASSFVTFVISIFFAMAELITPYHVLMFIGLSVLSLILTIFYK